MRFFSNSFVPGAVLYASLTCVMALPFPPVPPPGPMPGPPGHIGHGDLEMLGIFGGALAAMLLLMTCARYYCGNGVNPVNVAAAPVGYGSFADNVSVR